MILVKMFIPVYKLRRIIPGMTENVVLDYCQDFNDLYIATVTSINEDFVSHDNFRYFIFILILGVVASYITSQSRGSRCPPHNVA